MGTNILLKKDKLYISNQVLLHYPTNSTFSLKIFYIYLSIQEWDHALHLLHSYHGKDIFNNTNDKMIHDYKDAILSYIQTSRDDLIERREKLQTTIERFNIVYSKQKDIAEQRLHDEQNNEVLFDDNQSLYSTASSQAGSMFSTTSYNSASSANTNSSSTSANTMVSHNTVITTKSAASTSTTNTQFSLTSVQDMHKH